LEYDNSDKFYIHHKQIKFYKDAAFQLYKLEEKLKNMRKLMENKTVVVKGGCS